RFPSRAEAVLVTSPQPAAHDSFYRANGPHKPGLYLFALKERPDRNIDFAVSLWWPDGNNFGVDGVAQPSGNGWRYQASSANHCVVSILMTKTSSMHVRTTKTWEDLLLQESGSSPGAFLVVKVLVL